MNILNTILHSNLINFIIVIAIIIWLIKKADLAAIIAKVQNEIAESIKNAEEEKNIKSNLLSVTKSKVSNIEQEVSSLIKEGEQVANNISENILVEAEKQSDEMQKKALTSVSNEKKMISADVRIKITNAAFYVAEEHIKNSVDERLHKKYIDEFINNLDAIQI